MLYSGEPVFVRGGRRDHTQTSKGNSKREKVTLVFRGKWKMVLLKRGNVQPACSLTDKISMDTMVLGQLTGCLLVIK